MSMIAASNLFSEHIGVDNLYKIKKCTTCINSGETLKTQLPNTKKKQNDGRKKTGQTIKIWI